MDNDPDRLVESDSQMLVIYHVQKQLPYQTSSQAKEIGCH